MLIILIMPIKANNTNNANNFNNANNANNADEWLMMLMNDAWVKQEPHDRLFLFYFLFINLFIYNSPEIQAKDNTEGNEWSSSLEIYWEKKSVTLLWLLHKPVLSIKQSCHVENKEYTVHSSGSVVPPDPGVLALLLAEVLGTDLPPHGRRHPRHHRLVHQWHRL